MARLVRLEWRGRVEAQALRRELDRAPRAARIDPARDRRKTKAETERAPRRLRVNRSWRLTRPLRCSPRRTPAALAPHAGRSAARELGARRPRPVARRSGRTRHERGRSASIPILRCPSSSPRRGASEPGTELGRDRGRQRSVGEQSAIETSAALRAPAPRKPRGGAPVGGRGQGADLRCEPLERRPRYSCPRAWSRTRSTTQRGRPGRVIRDDHPRPTAQQPGRIAGGTAQRPGCSRCRGSSWAGWPSKRLISAIHCSRARATSGARKLLDRAPAAHGRLAHGQNSASLATRGRLVSSARRCRTRSPPGSRRRSPAVEHRRPEPRPDAPAAPTRHGPRTGTRPPSARSSQSTGYPSRPARELVANAEHARHRARRGPPRTAALVVGGGYRDHLAVDRGPRRAASASRGRRSAGTSSRPPSDASVSRSASTQASAPASRPSLGSISAHGQAGRIDPRPPSRGAALRKAASARISTNGVRPPTAKRKMIVAAQASQSTLRRPWRRPDERVEPGGRNRSRRDRRASTSARGPRSTSARPPLAAQRQPASAERRGLLPARGVGRASRSPSIQRNPRSRPPPQRIGSRSQQQDRALVLVNRPQTAAEAGGDRPHAHGLVAAERTAGPGAWPPAERRERDGRGARVWLRRVVGHDPCRTLSARPVAGLPSRHACDIAITGQSPPG